MIKKFLPLLVLVLLLMPVIAFGEPCSTSASSDLPPCSGIGYINNESPSKVGIQSGDASNPITMGIVVNTAVSLVNWMTWFVGLAAVVMGLYSGFLFITARDDANQLATARKIMLYAIIGIAVAILAFSLVSISKSLLGLH